MSLNLSQLCEALGLPPGSAGYLGNTFFRPQLPPDQPVSPSHEAIVRLYATVDRLVAPEAASRYGLGTRDILTPVLPQLESYFQTAGGDVQGAPIRLISFLDSRFVQTDAGGNPVCYDLAEQTYIDQLPFVPVTALSVNLAALWATINHLRGANERQKPTSETG